MKTHSLASLLVVSLFASQALAQKPNANKGTLRITTPKPAPSLASSPVIITVKANPEVLGEFFKLGDIADLAGRDEAYKRDLAAVEIGRSPLPGNTRNLSQGDIVVKLRGAKLDSDRLELIAPPLMRVSRAKSDVSNDKILQVALSAVQEALGETPGTSFEPLPLHSNITLPAGKLRYVAGSYRGNPETGNLSVPVRVIAEDNSSQTIEATIRVRRKMRVLIATRVLEPRDILTAEDVALAQIELPSGFSQPAPNLKAVIGKRVRRRVLADAPLSLAYLETPPAVNAKDTLTLEYATGPLQLTAIVTARQSGSIGDTIRVYCEQTKKEIEAVVIDSKTVRLIGATAE